MKIKRKRNKWIFLVLSHVARHYHKCQFDLVVSVVSCSSGVVIAAVVLVVVEQWDTSATAHASLFS